MPFDDLPDAGNLLGKQGNPPGSKDRIDWGCASRRLPVLAPIAVSSFVFLAR